MSTPLPIQDIFLKALIVPWHQRAALLRTLFLPALALVLLGRLGDDWVQGNWARMIPMWIASGILYTFIAVTCHRLVLMGEQAVPRFGLMTFTRRELRFLLLMTAIYAMGVLSMIIGGTIAINLLPDSNETIPNYAETVFSWASFLLVGFAFARLGMVLPATAVDEKRNLSWAWQISRGNSLRLFFVVGVIPYALGYLARLIDLGSGSIASILYSVLWLILLVVEIAALSLSYQALTTPVNR